MKKIRKQSMANYITRKTIVFLVFILTFFQLLSVNNSIKAVSTESYLNFVLQQLSDVENVTYKKMMGEYMLYSNGVLFGGIYDDRLLIKATDAGSDLLTDCPRVSPYSGSKQKMFFIQNLDDKPFLKQLIIATCDALTVVTESKPPKKPRRIERPVSRYSKSSSRKKVDRKRKLANVSDSSMHKFDGVPATKLNPNLFVSDVKASIAFYETVGFSVRAIVPDSEKPVWASVCCGDVEIMLQHLDSAKSEFPFLAEKPIGATVSMYTKTNCVDKLYEVATMKGLDIAVAMHDTPYGMREFALRDPNGYVIVFAQDKVSGKDVPPVVSLSSLSPNLFVSDVKASINFYERLGFKVVATVPDTINPVWACVRCGDVEIMLQHLDSAKSEFPFLAKRGIGATLTLFTRTECVDALHSMAKSVGLNIVVDMHRTPYGADEFAVLDPDGYVIDFAQIK